MSIPLDRLYHYIENIAKEIYNDPVIIYRFYPYGSKKLEDLLPIEYYTWEQVNLIPGIYCNDQEPLNFNFYETYELSDSNNWCNILKVIDTQYNKNNLKRSSIYNQALLIHSEIRSKNLK